jgi:hypothetical protein
MSYPVRQTRNPTQLKQVQTQMSLINCITPSEQDSSPMTWVIGKTPLASGPSLGCGMASGNWALAMVEHGEI